MNKNSKEEIIEISKKDIAVIGMSGRIGSFNNLSDFWKALLDGKDDIHELSESRKQNCIDIMNSKGLNSTQNEYAKAAFLDEIDKFDYEFFGLSPKEACLINPQQRLFLETVYNTLEDAGYAVETLEKSKTGVFVGIMSDAGEEYKNFAYQFDELQGVSCVGNMNSIIGARISYLFDFAGPSLMVDTACSSGLTAVHLACQAIRNGDCEMAVCGSVKINYIPLKIERNSIDINSADQITRSFDESADGTGSGEGVCALMLKSYSKALVDGDNVYAVIKGTAANHDGKSIGITAPNVLSQEEVITKAWVDAGIDPETIAYIEAHGTGTKLGDPIEISGIQRAFNNYTNKKQFCAISSVKTNIGHLDQASGIAGLIKAILAVKNKKIPSLIHFNKPNHKINFIESAVYINDRINDWVEKPYPRRAGISSFGLSGTNCHVVIEEAPEIESDNCKADDVFFLTISAKYYEGIKELVKKYIEWIHNHKEINLTNLCITANKGRSHYSYRLAIVFHNVIELEEKLTSFYKQKTDIALAERIYFQKCKVISNNKKICASGEITENEKKELSKSINDKIKKIYWNSVTESQIEEIVCAYIKGAAIDWEELYKGIDYNKISLPTYPFQKNKCWPVDTVLSGKTDRVKEIEHPFLDRCVVDSMFSDIFVTSFSVKRHWVLSEHKINGLFSLPGITFIEMIAEVSKKYFDGFCCEINELVFRKLLIVSEDYDKDVQTIVNKEGECFHITIASKKNEKWIKHAEGNLHRLTSMKRDKYDILLLKGRCKQQPAEKFSYNGLSRIEVGSRWDNIKECFYGDNELLVQLHLSEEFLSDFEDYHFYPSLIDNAMNAAIQMIGEGLYLPLSYQSIKIYAAIPNDAYSYVRCNEKKEDGSLATYDIDILDRQGRVCVTVSDYTIKRVEETRKELNEFYKIGWVQSNFIQERQDKKRRNILIFTQQTKECKNIVHMLKCQYNNVIEVELGERYKKNSTNSYIIANNEVSYYKLIESVVDDKYKIHQIIHLFSMDYQPIQSIDQFEAAKERGVMSLFYLSRTLLKRIKEKLDIVIISNNVNKIIENEDMINAQAAALFGLANTISNEYPKIKCTCIDIDNNTELKKIISELAKPCRSQIGYRNGKRYIMEFQKFQLDQTQIADFCVNSEGVYIITGGTGGLGLEFGKYIAKKGKVNIALLGRSDLPARENWKEILSHSEKDTSLIRKIRGIREIEKIGANVKYYCVDVSNYEHMSHVFNELRNEYKKINGVIHSAGIAGDGYIIKKDEKVFRNVLSPKMDGTWILDNITNQDKLEFFVLFSSIATLFWNAGQGDYTAANAYMDSFAALRNQSKKHTLCINWPAWKEIGMAADYNINQDGIFKAILTDEALASFEQIFYQDTCNIIIGKLNREYELEKFPIKIDKEIQRGDVLLSNNINHKSIAPEERKSAENSEEIKNNYSAIEKELASIWSEVLGIENIGLDDDFFEMGGNSILLIQVEVQMEKRNLLIASDDLFDYTTIRELAKFIESQDDNQRKTKCIIEGIIPFNELFYKECFYNSLFPIVNYYSGSINSFLINDIIVYEYNYNDYELNFGIKYITIKNNLELYSECGIECTTKNEVANIVEEAKTVILNNNMIIIWVDCYYISSRPDAYKIEHVPHTLLVYGFDEEKTLFYIIDHKNKDSLLYNKCVVSYEDLQNAYRGYVERYVNPNREDTLYIFSGSKIHKDTSRDFLLEFKNNIQSNREVLLVSMSVLRKIIKKLEGIISDEMKLNNYLSTLIERLNAIINSKYIEKFRLERIKCENQVLNQLLEEIINNWDLVRKFVVKYQYSGLFKKEQINSILKSLQKIPIIENKYTLCLIETLEN